MGTIALIAGIYLGGAAITFLYCAGEGREDGWRHWLFGAALFAIGWPLLAVILILTTFAPRSREG